MDRQNRRLASPNLLFQQLCRIWWAVVCRTLRPQSRGMSRRTKSCFNLYEPQSMRVMQHSGQTLSRKTSEGSQSVKRANETGFFYLSLAMIKLSRSAIC